MSNYTANNDLYKDPAWQWYRYPQQPRCYGKEFLANKCLPQTFFCAMCGHRCGKSGGFSHQCQDCGRHVCESCLVRCLDGRYHNPDWNAEPADAMGYFGAESQNENHDEDSTSEGLDAVGSSGDDS
jgi:hypothetical protein